MEEGRDVDTDVGLEQLEFRNQMLSSSLVRVNRSDWPRGSLTGSAFQSRLSKPTSPPCRWLGPLFVASAYAFPSISNAPLAMRLAQRCGWAKRRGQAQANVLPGVACMQL